MNNYTIDPKLEKDQAPPTGIFMPVHPVVTNIDLRMWMHRMGFTYDEAAYVLGVNRSSYATWLTGSSRTTGKPLALPRTVQLAAMAIEVGLHKCLPTPVLRTKKRPGVNEGGDGGAE